MPYFHLFAVVLIFSSGLFAGDLKSVWRDPSGKGAREFLAIVGPDEYTQGDSVLVFDRKLWGVRSFSLQGKELTLKTGQVFEGPTASYRIRLHAPEETKLSIHLRACCGKEYQTLYEKEDSFWELAEKASQKATKELQRVSEIRTPRNVGDFTDMLELVVRRTGNKRADTNFPLPTFDRQIGQSWRISFPDQSLLFANIQPDGSDWISRRFSLGERWAVENEVPHGEKNSNGLTYTFYRKAAKAFKTQALEIGAARFVRYEIVTITTVRCEDTLIDYEKYLWILTNGSIFTYQPKIQCEQAGN